MNIENIKGNTYIIKSNTNIGIYKINEKDIYLIDTGSTKEIAINILKLLKDNNLNVIGIINTHSHNDHIAGNTLIQNHFNCKIYINKDEKFMAENTLIEPMFLLGCKPYKQLLKYFTNERSITTNIEKLDKRFSLISLPGHSIGMTAIMTPDNVLFLGDALINTNKIKVGYNFDIAEHKKSLNKLKNIKADYYIPSHTDIYTDINTLIEENLDNIDYLEKLLLNISNNKTLEEIVSLVFTHFNIHFNILIYYTISLTIKNYLYNLIDSNKIEIIIKNNKIIYHIL